MPIEFLVPPKSAHLPSPNAPTSAPTSEETDPDFNRNLHVYSSSSRPMSDEGPQSHLTAGSMSGELARSDTMFLSSESLKQALNTERDSWRSDTLLQLPNTEDEFGEEDDEEEEGEEGDDDGYDIIEGMHRQGSDIDEGPEGVVVDEMDGIGAELPLINTAKDSAADEHVKSSVGSASALPVLTSASSPTTSRSPSNSFSHGSPSVSVTLPHTSPSSGAKRSPRRKDTVRQTDISPILTTRPELAPEDDESEPLTLPGGIPVYPKVADTLSVIALPLSVNPSQTKPPVGQVEEEDGLEEVDLAGPHSKDD